MKILQAATLLAAIVATAIHCSRPPYYATNKQYQKQAKQYASQLRSQPAGITVPGAPSAGWVGTTNFNMRKPNFVVIHHTAQNSCDQTLKTFTTPRTQVSAHYVICKNGTVHQMLNDYLRAWHGGIARWGNVSDLNSVSIGIELDNNGFEPFAEAQMQSLLVLLDTLKKRHSIPVANFIGHGDIAPTRKNDPNIHFAWKRLADKGFGLWYSDTAALQVPPHFNVQQGLRIVGYSTTDSIAAKLAFNRHFAGDTLRTIDDSRKKMLYSLVLKNL